jgi:hypothetical protein
MGRLRESRFGRINCTSDYKAAQDAVERLKAAVFAPTRPMG